MAKVFALRRLSTLVLRQRRQRLLRQLRLPPGRRRAAIVERFNPCGKPDCACARGQKHGPFYYLEHCYQHEPVSILAQMLILLLGFTLFTAFAQLHNKRVRVGSLTAKALARVLDLAWEEDLPWERWFHSG